MKNRNPFKLPNLPGTILFSLILILSSGCSSETTALEAIKSRHLFYFTLSRASFSINDPELLKFQSESIGGRMMPFTRTPVNSEFVKHSITIVQPVPLNRNHRLTGVSFSLRSLNGSFNLQPILMPDKAPFAFYIHPKKIRIQQGSWNHIELDFKDFTNIITSLNLSIDAFNPLYWDNVDFTLLFTEVSGDDLLVDIGPVHTIRQAHRYQFH